MKAKPKPSFDADGPSLQMAWKDATSLHVSWELTEDVITAIEDWFHIPLAELPFVIRLYDVTDRDIRRDGQDQYVDFHINCRAMEWILYGIEAERSYCVELGVLMIDGRYYELKRSNIV
jgi:hypothetical protein